MLFLGPAQVEAIHFTLLYRLLGEKNGLPDQLLGRYECEVPGTASANIPAISMERRKRPLRVKGGYRQAKL